MVMNMDGQTIKSWNNRTDVKDGSSPYGAHYCRLLAIIVTRGSSRQPNHAPELLPRRLKVRLGLKQHC